MCKGLPASGKSTWTKSLLSNGSHKRVNRDDLRAMIDDGVWSKKNEQFIVKIEQDIVTTYLGGQYSVIIDDTNLSPKNELMWRVFAEKYNAEFVIKDFTDVPLETCIERDLKRPNSVGSKAIMRMYNQFLAKKADERKLDPMVFGDSLPYCVIFDIDGTLAHITDRSPYDGKSCWSDEVNESIKLLNHMVGWYNKKYMSQHKWDIVLFSGRSGESEPETRKWLEDKNIDFQELHMRKPGDFRKDSIVKEEMFNEFIRDKYNVVFIVDDRKQVVDMWRSLGLTCLQVAPGEF